MKDPSAVQRSAQETSLDRHTNNGAVSVFYREREEVKPKAKNQSLAPALRYSLKSEKKRSCFCLFNFYDFVIVVIFCPILNRC